MTTTGGERASELARIGCIWHRITGDRRSRVRAIGWEYAHGAINNCSLLAYGVVLLLNRAGRSRRCYLARSSGSARLRRAGRALLPAAQPNV